MKEYVIWINGQAHIMRVQNVDASQGKYLVESAGKLYPCAVQEEPMDVQERIDRAISELPAPVINVNVPQQPAPIVNVASPQVHVNIPDVRLQAGSVAKVRRDYTGKIVAIDSTAQVTGRD